MKIKNGSKEYEFVRSVRRGSPYYIDWLISTDIDGYGKESFYVTPMNDKTCGFMTYSRDEINQIANKIASKMLECKCKSCNDNKEYWEFTERQSAYEKFKKSFKEKKEIKNGKLRNNKKTSK